MSEFPVIRVLDQNRIKNIILNAIINNCFNDDPNPQTRYNTMEVTIYYNTVLASPIDNNEAVGETVHDFIVLGNRCGGKDIGEQIASDYKVFLCVPKEFNGDTDDRVYNNALNDIIDNKDITILTLDENKKSMSTANILLQNSSGVSGHVKARSNDTNDNLLSPDNSVQPNTIFSTDNSIPSGNPSPMYSPGSQHTTYSAQEKKLDSMNEINLHKLKTALSTNINNINVDTLDIQDKKQYRDSLTEIFKNKCNQHEVNVESRVKTASDHGVKHLPESVQEEKYSVFNKMYDRRGTTSGKVDPELLNLSYVYYSRNPENGEIKGLLILLEDNRDSNDSNGSKSGKKAKSDQITVNMKKYLFSSNSTMQTIHYRPVIDTAPNVSTLCSEMANGSIDAVEVALMKAAADRTLKIGALLSSVGITTEIISFLTHDIKNYYYNKNLYVKKNGRLELIKLNAIYTSVYSRPTENCSRRIVIYQDIQNVDPELQELINRKSILTKKCETLHQEIDQLNNAATRLNELLDELLGRIRLIDTISKSTRRINVNDITTEYTVCFNTYIDITSKICPDDDFKGSLPKFIGKIKTASNSTELNTKDEITEVFTLLSNKVYSCIDSVKKTKTMKNEQLTICNSELEFTNGLINNYNNNVKKNIPFDDESSQKEKGGREEKGGKNVGGRRTKRSIKVITKRKIKVKSKTIKKKSRRRNKTRRQQKKL